MFFLHFVRRRAVFSGFCRKASILDACDFLGARCRKAMTPQKAMDFTSFPEREDKFSLRSTVTMFWLVFMRPFFLFAPVAAHVCSSPFSLHLYALEKWLCSVQESPRQTKPNKGPKQKVHEFRPFLWILVFFLGKTSTIHIELLFRNAPVKSSWTDLSLVWFAGATPDL